MSQPLIRIGLAGFPWLAEQEIAHVPAAVVIAVSVVGLVSAVLALWEQLSGARRKHAEADLVEAEVWARKEALKRSDPDQSPD